MIKKLPFFIKDDGKEIYPGWKKLQPKIQEGRAYSILDDTWVSHRKLVNKYGQFTVVGYEFDTDANLKKIPAEYKSLGARSIDRIKQLLAHDSYLEILEHDGRVAFKDLKKKGYTITKELSDNEQELIITMKMISTNLNKNYVFEGKISYFVWVGNLLVEVKE